MGRSRSEYVIKNINMTVIYQAVDVVLKFIIRSFFIYFLGKEYLGVSGVFSNILNVLSLAELGLGTAIVYDMYKPIAEKNYFYITQTVNFYKKIYSMIGIVIFIIGMSLMPFLRVIIKDVPNIQNIKLIFFLVLISTCSSYFFAQYSSLLNAYQLNYVITKIKIFTLLIKTILEIAVLFLFKNYIIYLLVELFSNILTNYAIYLKAYKLFPFIKDQVPPLGKNVAKGIFSNAVSVLSIKVGSTLLNATDNIIISAYVGTVLVGIYSNYGLIITTFLSLTVIMKNSLLASVGNLCVGEDRYKNKDIFEKIRFFYAGIYCVICTCLYSLLTPFIIIWLGEDYVLSQGIVFVLTLNCYLSGVKQPIEVLVYADGLFQYFRIKPWIEGLINIICSIFLVGYLGLSGVFLGTTISHCATSLWYDAYIVYKYSLRDNYINFWKKYVRYLGVTILAILLSSTLIKLCNLEQKFIMAAVVCLIISIGSFVLIFMDSEYFKYYFNMIKKKFLKL